MPSFVSWTLQINLLHFLFSKNGRLAYYFHCIIEIRDISLRPSHLLLHFPPRGSFFSTSADRTIHPSRECLDLPPSYQPIATFTSKLNKCPPIFSFVAAALMECPSQRCLPHVRYPLSWYCRWPREPTDNRKRYLTIIMFGAIATKRVAKRLVRFHIMIFYHRSIKSSVRRYNII